MRPHGVVIDHIVILLGGARNKVGLFCDKTFYYFGIIFFCKRARSRKIFCHKGGVVFKLLKRRVLFSVERKTESERGESKKRANTRRIKHRFNRQSEKHKA